MHFWHLITRLGEAEILLPLVLLVTLALLRRAETRPIALRWVLLLALAVALTTASKLAFIGWGIGSAALDFTGVSGHAMFAAAVYPLLLDALAGQAPRWAGRLAVAFGCMLALLVGISRIVVGAHSASEVVAGLLLGAAVSALVLAGGRLQPPRIGPLWPAAAALWLAFMPLQAPASRTHAAVTRVALALSGHAKPWTRHDLRRPERAEPARPDTLT